MKHHFRLSLVLLLAISILIVSCKKDEKEETPEANPTFTGSLINPSSSEMDDFYSKGYSIVSGDVVFSDNMYITNLDKISNLVEIKGHLVLSENEKLSNIDGLKNLTTVGGNVDLSRLFNLDDLTGLSSLETVGLNFTMNSLTKITNFQGLNKLKSVQGSLGMENRTPLANPQLQSTDGLESLEFVGASIFFRGNIKLDNYCEISDFLINDFKEDFSTSNNFYNPSIEEIRAGECEYDEPTVIILDGIYIKGSGTAITEFDSKGQMSITKNEVTHEDRNTLFEKFVAIKGGDEGFNIYVVDGGITKSYGPGNNFTFIQESNLDPNEPTLGLYRGSITESETPFIVSEDGLYHVAYDTEIGIVTIAKVEWGIIGAATPGGWASSTPLNYTFDLSEIRFSIEELTLTRADYKFRYSNGWKVILDPDFDLGDGYVGIKVNSNYGGAVDALVPGGDNIVNDDSGIYTISIIWTLEGGTTATVEKTGDLEAFDYSTTELGLVGDGLMVDGEQHNWDVTVLPHVPVTDETNYSWTYEDVEVSTLGSFKLREGQDWNGKVIGYEEVTMAGTAATDFDSNGDGNFVPLYDGNYDFELLIDAITENYTLIVTPSNGPEPELYLLGDACSAGWDNTIALPFSGSDGVYTITTELLVGDSQVIKFISTLGQWAPMYGTDENGTAQSGNLVFRETESDPDPDAIPVESDGTYTIIVNTNTMTYNVIPAK